MTLRGRHGKKSLEAWQAEREANKPRPAAPPQARSSSRAGRLAFVAVLYGGLVWLSLLDTDYERPTCQALNAVRAEHPEWALEPHECTEDGRIAVEIGGAQ